MAELTTTPGRFKAYGIVRDAFGRVKVDDLEKIKDPAFRKLIEDAIKEQEANSGCHPSRSSS